jgi:hypothetical protein
MASVSVTCCCGAQMSYSGNYTTSQAAEFERNHEGCRRAWQRAADRRAMAAGALGSEGRTYTTTEDGWR